MTFSIRIRRLLAHRQIDPATLPDPVTDHPDPQLIRRLAPFLGLHTADLFVIAQHPPPHDLAPSSTKTWNVASVLSYAVKLSPGHLHQVHDTVRAMPLIPSAEPPAPIKDYPHRSGGMLLRLLANRNIPPWSSALLCRVGGGPYVANSTIFQLGQGGVKLTPHYVTAFGHLLGIDAGDLAALTRVGPPVESTRLHPQRAQLAQLAWDSRQLNADQISEIRELAATLWRRQVTDQP